MSTSALATGLDPARLGALLDLPLDESTKGVPLGVTTTLADVGSHGWNVAAGDLSLPVTTLYADAVESNLRSMAEYCERHGASSLRTGRRRCLPSSSTVSCARVPGG